MNETTFKDLQFVSRFRSTMFDNQIMLSYKGEISQDIMLGLLDLTEKKLDSSNADLGVKSKIFNVMVGCLQNVTYHSDKNKHAKSSMFLIGRVDGGYAIYSGNAISKDKVADLKTKLMSINDMSGAELTEFYKSWLTSRELSEKSGIGLGLIDIARKTGNPLEFDFENIDEEYNYFSLRTVVKTNL
jgi:hypothetical protein